MVNAESAVPLYSQMKENILERIHSGELKSGSRIPSEKELAKHYSVSLITVRRAISELVDAKVLEKKTGERYIRASAGLQTLIPAKSN